MSRVKQYVGMLGMEDIWENGRHNYNNIWIRVSEGCAGIKRRNMEVTMEERERQAYKHSITL
jgi:hypothetical protein